MVWINTICSNVKAPPGYIGGSMCVCPKCSAKRDRDKELKDDIQKDEYLEELLP